MSDDEGSVSSAASVVDNPLGGDVDHVEPLGALPNEPTYEQIHTVERDVQRRIKLLKKVKVLKGDLRESLLSECSDALSAYPARCGRLAAKYENDDNSRVALKTRRKTRYLVDGLSQCLALLTTIRTPEEAALEENLKRQTAERLAAERAAGRGEDPVTAEEDPLSGFEVVEERDVLEPESEPLVGGAAEIPLPGGAHAREEEPGATDDVRQENTRLEPEELRQERARRELVELVRNLTPTAGTMSTSAPATAAGAAL